MVGSLERERGAGEADDRFATVFSGLVLNARTSILISSGPIGWEFHPDTHLPPSSTYQSLTPNSSRRPGRPDSQPTTMSTEPTETTAAQSIAGAPQTADDLQVKNDGQVEPVKQDQEEGQGAEAGDKTIFDDAGNFNVKVRVGTIGFVVHRGVRRG